MSIAMSPQQVRNALCDAIGNDAWFEIPFPVRVQIVFAAHRLLEGCGSR